MRYALLILGALALSAPFVPVKAKAGQCFTHCYRYGNSTTCNTECF